MMKWTRVRWGRRAAVGVAACAMTVAGLTGLTSADAGTGWQTSAPAGGRGCKGVDLAPVEITACVVPTAGRAQAYVVYRNNHDYRAQLPATSVAILKSNGELLALARCPSGNFDPGRELVCVTPTYAAARFTTVSAWGTYTSDGTDYAYVGRAVVAH